MCVGMCVLRVSRWTMWESHNPSTWHLCCLLFLPGEAIYVCWCMLTRVCCVCPGGQREKAEQWQSDQADWRTPCPGTGQYVWLSPFCVVYTVGQCLQGIRALPKQSVWLDSDLFTGCDLRISDCCVGWLRQMWYSVTVYFVILSDCYMFFLVINCCVDWLRQTWYSVSMILSDSGLLHDFFVINCCVNSQGRCDVVLTAILSDSFHCVICMNWHSQV